MSKKQTQTLIDGYFNKAEAKEILTNLFNSKIKFHTIAAFSLEERANSKAKEHNKRKKELSNSLELLLKSIQENSDKSTEIILDCQVKMSFKSKEKKKKSTK
jgi:hypothetical protein